MNRQPLTAASSFILPPSSLGAGGGEGKWSAPVQRGRGSRWTGAYVWRSGGGRRERAGPDEECSFAVITVVCRNPCCQHTENDRRTAPFIGEVRLRRAGAVC